jgi:hypothetical protein
MLTKRKNEVKKMKNYLLTYAFPQFPKEKYQIVWRGVDVWDARKRFVSMCNATNTPVWLYDGVEVKEV